MQNLHPNQFVVPRCLTAPPSKAALSYLPQSRDRKDSWKERASPLQALAQTMAQAHADKAFFLFLEGGPTLQTIQEAAPKVHGIYQDPGWTQHVLQHIKRASVPACPSASIAPPAASRPAATKKRPHSKFAQPRRDSQIVNTNTAAQGGCSQHPRTWHFRMVLQEAVSRSSHIHDTIVCRSVGSARYQCSSAQDQCALSSSGKKLLLS